MKCTKQGFTLLEVLVALVIISITFTGFFVSLTSISENNRTIQDKTVATIISSNLMTKMRLGLMNAGTGQIEMANKHWTYQIGVQTVQDEPMVEIKVSVATAKNQVVSTLTGYRLIHEK